LPATFNKIKRGIQSLCSGPLLNSFHDISSFIKIALNQSKTTLVEQKGLIFYRKKILQGNSQQKLMSG